MEDNKEIIKLCNDMYTLADKTIDTMKMCHEHETIKKTKVWVTGLICGTVIIVSFLACVFFSDTSNSAVATNNNTNVGSGIERGK